MIARMIALTLFASMAACGTSAGEDEPTKKVDDRCLAVDQVNLDAITGTLQDGLKATRGSAVKSKDYKSVYMIAVKFSGNNGDGPISETGVWATNDNPTDSSLDGVLMAGDAFSEEFSAAPRAQVENGSDGMSQAKKCLG